MSFIREIREQPIVAHKLFNAIHESSLQEQTAHLKEKIAEIQPKQYIFAGMGSSLYASYILVSLLQRQGIQAFAMEASELDAFSSPIIGPDTFLFCVSQSGNSMETVALCKRFQGHPGLAVITNSESSNLYGYGCAHFILGAGPEYHSATKTYTNTVLMMLYLAEVITGKPCVQLMQNAPAAIQEMDRLINMDVVALADFWQGSEYTAIVGSGVDYCSASHGALIMMETAHINAAHYTAGQFIHGPIEIINKHFCSIIFDFEQAGHRTCERVMELTEKYDGKVIYFTARQDIKSNAHRFVVHIDCKEPTLATLANIIPIELVCLELGNRAGLCPGDLYRVHK